MPGSTSAQAGEPAATIDSIMNDLGRRLGRNYNRANTNYTWDQQRFPTAGLGCEQPGQTYAQVQTLGYVITLKPFGSDVTYDYRAYMDGRFFLCSPAGVPNPPASPVPPTIPGPAPSPVPTATTVPRLPGLAFIGPDGNVSIGSAAAGASRISITGDGRGLRLSPAYTSLRWSPDGRSLLFWESSQMILYVVTAGRPPVSVAQPVTGPFAWSPDGREIAYFVNTLQPAPGTANKTLGQIQAIPSNGGAPRPVATITLERCQMDPKPRGPIDPFTELYFNDAVAQESQVLYWTPQGFIHSNCFNGSLTLTNTSGKEVWTTPNAIRAALSQDRRRLVFIRSDKPVPDLNAEGQTVVLVDVATGQQTPLPSKPNAYLAVWSGNDQIMYATVTQTTAFNGDPVAKLGPRVMPGWPFNLTGQPTSVWYMAASGENPAAGSDSALLYTADGLVGTMSVAADTSRHVAFSLISSPGLAIDRINANAPINDVAAVMPRVSVIVTTLNAPRSPFVVQEARQPVLSTQPDFAAVPAALKVCPNTPAPRLVVGGRGRVMPGEPNALNSLPVRPSVDTRSFRLDPIQPGGTFTVLNGPVCSDGFNWWRVNANGAIGWTAEGEGSTYWIESVQ
jgi:hypothetical protein